MFALILIFPLTTVAETTDEVLIFVAEQLNEIGKLGDIILEPVSRSTAPAIALASFISLKRDDDSSTLVLSADNDIKDIESFTVAIKDSIQFSESNNIVTYGITPNKPQPSNNVQQPITNNQQTAANSQQPTTHND